MFSPQLSMHNHLNIILVKDLSYNVMQCCNSIIAASGTATLEISLMGIPYCITYKVAHLSYFILKQMIKIEHLGLANIISGKEIVKEFIQYNTKPGAISHEVIRTLDDEDYREMMISSLDAVRDMLGKTGGTDNMAELILQMLGE